MDDQPDTLPFEPPEAEYVVEKYVLRVPADDKHLKDKWELRKYSAKLLEREIKDYAQITSIKVKKPKLISRKVAKLLGKEPQAKLFLTVKF